MKVYDHEYKITIKDTIIIIFLAGLEVAHIISFVIANGYTGVGNLIEQTLLITFSIIGLIDCFDLLNLGIFVPDFYTYCREKRRSDNVEAYMMEYFKDNIKFMRDYSEEKTKFILSQLGITTSQLDEIRLCLIKMRCMPLKDLGHAQEKIKYYVKSDYPMVISQKDIDSSKLCYHSVDYYINFQDPMFLPEYAREIASLLSFLIKEKADLNKVDRLVVPHDSNFLLGVEVSKCLGKPVVKMRSGSQGKVIKEQHWDGQLDDSDRVIIIHDVLVKAEQIIYTLGQLPTTCEVLGVYCLITRKEWDGADKLRNKKVCLEQIICLDDDDIRAIRGEK